MNEENNQPVQNQPVGNNVNSDKIVPVKNDVFVRLFFINFKLISLLITQVIGSFIYDLIISFICAGQVSFDDTGPIKFCGIVIFSLWYKILIVAIIGDIILYINNKYNIEVLRIFLKFIGVILALVAIIPGLQLIVFWIFR